MKKKNKNLIGDIADWGIMVIMIFCFGLLVFFIYKEEQNNKIHIYKEECRAETDSFRLKVYGDNYCYEILRIYSSNEHFEIYGSDQYSDCNFTGCQLGELLLRGKCQEPIPKYSTILKKEIEVCNKVEVDEINTRKIVDTIEINKSYLCLVSASSTYNRTKPSNLENTKIVCYSGEIISKKGLTKDFLYENCECLECKDSRETTANKRQQNKVICEYSSCYIYKCFENYFVSVGMQSTGSHFSAGS